MKERTLEMDFKKLAADILENIGGEKNVQNVTHCATRLRFHLVDDSKANKEAIENLKGVFSVVNKSGQFQVIVGNDVPNVYKELVKLGNFSSSAPVKEEKKKFKLTDLFDIISSIFVPVVPALAGCGLLKGILSLLTTFGLLDTASQTYIILSIVGDAGFYFLPMMLAYTSAQKFKANPFYAVVMASVMLHPNLSVLFESKEAIHFLGLPVTVAKYASSVIPIILIVWVMSYVQRFFEKYVPKAVKLIVVPLCTFLIMVPVALIVLGPLGTIVGDALAGAILFLDGKVSWLIPTIIGGLTPLMVMTGMHYSLFPGVFQQMATVGYQTIFPGMVVSNLCQGAASLAVALKAKNKELKELAFSVGVTALLGVTEPALYGVTMKLKRPLYAVLAGGAAGGFYMGLTGVRAFAPNGASILQIGVYIGGDGFSNVINLLIGVVIGFVITFILTLILGFEDSDKEKSVEKVEKAEEKKLETKSAKTVISSPLNGELVALNTVNDETFASEVMGKGVAIIPADGKVVSPVDGEISALFGTNHAIGLTSKEGVEVLIHIGIDTVELNGEGFTAHIKQGDKVKKGDLLVEFDLDFIKEKGYDPTTMMIITNSANYLEFIPAKETHLKQGDKALVVI